MSETESGSREAESWSREVGTDPEATIRAFISQASHFEDEEGYDSHWFRGPTRLRLVGMLGL